MAMNMQYSMAITIVFGVMLLLSICESVSISRETRILSTNGRKRCPNGSRRNKKTGKCEKKPTTTTVTSPPPVVQPPSTTTKRCPNGSRRNKKTGKCEKKPTTTTVTSPPPVVQPPSIARKRCPNGSRRNKKTGKCEKKPTTTVTSPPPVVQPSTTTKRCPNGSRRNKKTGKCEKKPTTTTVTSPPPVVQPPSTTTKRCPNGSRRNKKTGKCEKKPTATSPSTPSTPPTTTAPRRKRCPAGFGRNRLTGKCDRRCKRTERLGDDNNCYPKPTSDCGTGTFWHNGVCKPCTKCKSGERMIRKCEPNHDRLCKRHSAAPRLGEDPQCISDSNRPVDYFVVFKMPHGGEYYYMDPTTDGKLVRSTNDLHNDDGAVFDTLEPVYTEKIDDVNRALVMYNDEPATGSKAGPRFAHSKGVVYAGKSRGFWLLHSMPLFPSVTQMGYEELPSYRFGQAFLCLTLGITELEKVAAQLHLMRVRIYEKQLHKDLLQQMPQFKTLLGRKRSTIKQNVVSITTLGGKVFKSFAKSREWANAGELDVHLYRDLVAPELKSPLIVNTWQNGDKTNKMANYCGGAYPISNVQTIRLGNDMWPSTADHSKWAIATNSKDVCIGDVNRQFSQNKRGGGTVCFKDAKLWAQLDKAATEREACP